MQSGMCAYFVCKYKIVPLDFVKFQNISHLTVRTCFFSVLSLF